MNPAAPALATNQAANQAANQAVGPAADRAEGLAENRALEHRLREMATLLDAQGDNPYRVLAYRRAADTLAGLDRPVRQLYDAGGLAGLDALPTIGPGIAGAIAEWLTTGRWRQLERERLAADPPALLRAVPGVGPALANRLHLALGVTTLEDLELAARDGRLAAVPGLGPRRAAAIGAALTQLLDQGRVARRRPAAAPAGGPEPPVDWLLAVDRDYRAGAAAGTLPTIAPRRFNPGGRAWLPVLHAQRGDWRCTALFANTARAHALGRVHDWVVLYCEGPGRAEHQYTVVTARRGRLAGRRVVRGREAACRALDAPA